MPPTPTSWQTCYPTLTPGDWVAEPPATWHRTIPETLVRCLWFDQRWRPTVLRTLDGRAITVHTPGRWNVQAGPDFQQAHLEFAGGTRCQGDVEIHCYASGWTAHRHHLDPRYNNVILHVFLWNDRQALEAHRADGQPLPQLALADYLPRPLADYQVAISLEDYPYKTDYGYGQCYASLQARPLQDVQDLLNCAGDRRLQERAWRWAWRAADVGMAQVMYEALLRSLGATGYRQRFQELARLVTWHGLQRCLASVAPAQRGLAAEALLFGLAGMLQPPSADPHLMDEATQHYHSQLWQHWYRMPASVRRQAWHAVNWRQPGVRPANTPERRLAGMAQVLASYHDTTLFDAALAACQSSQPDTNPQRARALCQALVHLVQVPATSYWSQRTTWGGRPTRTQHLVGAQRALTTLVDAILPVLLLHAQQRSDLALSATLRAVYAAAPRLPDNHLLRYMRHRALGNNPALLASLTGARPQQGLLQLFADYCSNDEGNCQGCAFPLA